MASIAHLLLKHQVPCSSIKTLPQAETGTNQFYVQTGSFVELVSHDESSKNLCLSCVKWAELGCQKLHSWCALGYFCSTAFVSQPGTHIIRCLYDLCILRCCQKMHWPSANTLQPRGWQFWQEAVVLAQLLINCAQGTHEIAHGGLGAAQVVQAAAAAVWGCATSSRTRRLLTEIGAVEALLTMLQMTLVMDTASGPGDAAPGQDAAPQSADRDRLQVKICCAVLCWAALVWPGLCCAMLCCTGLGWPGLFMETLCYPACLLARCCPAVLAYRRPAGSVFVSLSSHMSSCVSLHVRPRAVPCF